MAGDEIGFVDADLHRVCTAVSCLSKRGLHECAAESVAAVRRGDVELREIALETTTPDCVAEAEHREPVGAVADQQDDGVAAPEQVRDALLEVRHAWRRLVELAVEVVQQLCH